MALFYDAQQDLLPHSFVKAFAEGDADRFCRSSFFTEDTIYMQENLPIQRGGMWFSRRGMLNFLCKQPKQVDRNLRADRGGDFIWGYGIVVRGLVTNSLKGTPEGETVTKAYKYMILSEKQEDGSWQMKFTFNFDDDY